MGNCVSFAPQGKPKCATCGKQGELDWHLMNSQQKRAWVWTGDNCSCKTCLIKGKQEQIKYEKERAFYQKAKGELYPKPEPQKRLKRIHSNEEWQGTQSFYESWKLPSTLAHLVQTLSPLGQRKGTGVVGDTTTAAAAAQGQGSGEGPSGSQQIYYRAASEELEALEEEIEMVEEHSLSSECSGSVGDVSVHSESQSGSVLKGGVAAGQSRREFHDLG